MLKFCVLNKHTETFINIIFAQATEEVRRLKAVGSEVEVIKAQQEEFIAFRESVVEPIGKSVEEVNRLGQGLVQSAAGGVNTSALEKDLEKVNDRWNTLKDKVRVIYSWKE